MAKEGAKYEAHTLSLELAPCLGLQGWTNTRVRNFIHKALWMDPLGAIDLACPICSCIVVLRISCKSESKYVGRYFCDTSLKLLVWGRDRCRKRNGSELVSLQELVLFTSSRVPELTEGQQRPQIPALSLNVDYPLSIATN